jgi:uncharacterized protein
MPGRASPETLTVASTLANRPLSSSVLPPRGRAWLSAGVALGGVALVVLPRVPGEVGIKATGVALAFVSLVAESLPFLLAGAAIVALLQGRAGRRLFTAARRHPRLAAALAPLSGAALPVCDCGMVPLARKLNAAGARGGAVNGFVAGAPLTNPIVILSTIVAFGGQVGMVAGRVVVGVAVAMLAGALAPPPAARRVDGDLQDAREGRDAGVQAHGEHEEDHHENGDHGHPGGAHGPKNRRLPGAGLAASIGDELGRTGPTLVLGGLAAATVKGLVPPEAFTLLAGQPLVGAVIMMALAFLMSICSQADAFVAASLPVGYLPRLAFLVLGPMFDLRLAALYRREFGGRWVAGYAAVVVPSVLAVATLWTVWGPR